MYDFPNWLCLQLSIQKVSKEGLFFCKCRWTLQVIIFVESLAAEEEEDSDDSGSSYIYASYFNYPLLWDSYARAVPITCFHLGKYFINFSPPADCERLPLGINWTLSYIYIYIIYIYVYIYVDVHLCIYKITWTKYMLQLQFEIHNTVTLTRWFTWA